MKVALVYDRVNKWGGAEAVLLALHKLFPNAPLFTSVYNKETASWANVFEVKTTFLQKLPLPKSAHEWFPYLMGPAFETLKFDEYDLVISITSEFAKAIITKPNTTHICYCLNPTSYLWSGYDQYFSGKSKLFRLIASPLVSYLRWYDKLASLRPDVYIAISNTVKNRLKNYYQVDSEVIYPPVSFPKEIGKVKKTDSYLVLSRLVPNKRIDLIVETFNKNGLPLTIAGTGRELVRLKEKAKNNIKFTGFVTEEIKWELLRSSRALIIPAEEDFGITAVEAQAVGTPIIAYKRGGVTETVIDNVTGVLFDDQTVESLSQALEKSLKTKFDPNNCRHNAEKFSTIVFEKSFLAQINRICSTK